MKDTIYRKISSELSPQKLEVIDQSHLHKGHGGYKDGGETHFKIVIFYENIKSLPRIDLHRRINNILASELKTQIHALEIEIKSL